MSLRTRFGNLGNILDFKNLTEENIYVLESPILSNAQFEKFFNFFKNDIKILNCTFDVEKGLRQRLDELRVEAEIAVREGIKHLILSDKQVDLKNAPVPMILAIGAIIVGKVVNSFWADAQGTPPNWHGKSLDTLFPGWGPFLDKMEAEVRGVKETVATAKKSLDPIINWLDGKMKELEVFSTSFRYILIVLPSYTPVK